MWRGLYGFGLSASCLVDPAASADAQDRPGRALSMPSLSRERRLGPVSATEMPPGWGDDRGRATGQGRSRRSD